MLKHLKLIVNYLIMIVISFDIGIKNMAYCIASFNNELNIIKLNKIDLNIHNKSTIQNLIDNTIEFLDEIFHNEIILNDNECLKVLIECQMTSKMKCIQTTINTYFKMISKFENIDIETLYLSAKHKLDLTKKYPNFSLKDDSKSNYKNNKINAVSFANYLLDNKYFNNNISDIIKKEKKKDDVCDALLMIFYYYEK
jgi:hypothetical protein